MEVIEGPGVRGVQVVGWRAGEGAVKITKAGQIGSATLSRDADENSCIATTKRRIENRRLWGAFSERFAPSYGVKIAKIRWSWWGGEVWGRRRRPKSYFPLNDTMGRILDLTEASEQLTFSRAGGEWGGVVCGRRR